MLITMTELEVARDAHWEETERRLDELAELTAHLSAATARWLELAWELHEKGESSDPAGFLACRCGIRRRDAREYLRVAEALQELPAIRAAFSRGELTFTKVRSLTLVATPASEAGLLELAGALTASQLERALRAFRRIALEDVRDAHELEYVDYFFAHDGSLVLRARVASEDGTLLLMALDAARERIVERRREERSRAGHTEPQALPATVEAPRSAAVEALIDLAARALDADPRTATATPGVGTRVVVHVDAAALTSDAAGRSELGGGPVIAPETARRLGCDAELVAQVERDGLPLSVGRTRRTVPQALRRLLESRDDNTCCFPGCERQRHLQAHHRQHWAHGGETSLENLVLLCYQHHRLVHEGGYTIEGDHANGLRFRNRFGLVCATPPPRPPPGSERELRDMNTRLGLTITPDTATPGLGRPLDLARTVCALKHIAA